MKALKGTLIFVLGMLIGIILFVVAIGGTVAILATQLTVGDLQQTIIGSDSVISSESEIYKKTILEAVTDVIIKDIQNFDKLSMQTLYDHYGIRLLNGISGIDFTTKDFYSVPIPDIINDLSIVVNSFTLNDVSKIAGVDFASYGLPVLTKNLNNNLSTAMDNILGSLNGNLTIRDIYTQFGIDIGINDNPLLATLQDVVLSEFGNVMTVMRVSSILEADTDVFVPSSGAKRFTATDVYEQILPEELPLKTCKLGAETSLIGGEDADGDGKADKMNIVETRYVREVSTDENGVQTESYTVDNSSYGAEFDFENNGTAFYRHIKYAPAQESGENTYVLGYANRIDTISGEDYTLVEKGFFLESELEYPTERWAMSGDVLDKDSKLAELEEGQTADKTFIRVKTGTSTALLQSIAHMTVGELQDADNLLDGMTVGDVIEITPDSAKIMKSLVARNCKITELGEAANDLTLGEMIDIKSFTYEASATGKYVRVTDQSSFTLYDKQNPDMVGATRYKKDAEGNFVEDPNGKFVNSVYYTLYNPALHSESTRYNRKPLSDGEETSSFILQRFAGSTLGTFSSAFDELMLADVMEIDADVYAAVDRQYIEDSKNNNRSERFYYYDSAKCVYRVADDAYLAANPDATIYRVEHSGSSTGFLKKLAYVKVDGMADAMNDVINDMILSDIISVYENDAVAISPNGSAPGVSGSSYFVEAAENVNGQDFTYVYDAAGDYVTANYRPVPLETTTIDINYKYVQFNATTDAAKLANLNLTNNLFCLKAAASDTSLEESFMRNRVLANYMLLKPEYQNKVYYRVATAEGEIGIVGKMASYTGATPTFGIYVHDSVSGYIEYDASNPAFADMPLYTFEKAEAGKLFFVTETEAKHMALALKTNPAATSDPFVSSIKSETSDGVYYARKTCNTVYVRTDKTQNVWVFRGGSYEEYDSSNPEHADLDRFEKKIGYIATIDEAFYNGTPLNAQLAIVTEHIRERSSRILRTLSDCTIGEMPGIINNATIGSVIDTEPGSFFDSISDVSISKLDDKFKDILNTMTIGDLMTWSNSTPANESVRAALNDITVHALLSSIVIEENFEMKVNMLKLYGYEA